MVEDALNEADFANPRSIGDVLEIDARVRSRVESAMKALLSLMWPQPPLWLTLVAFVCALGPLVFFHELGHYLVARLFEIPAEIFSIGFGREIVGWTDRQGTRWKIGWLPLGGYVRFVGDMSPASNPAELDHIAPELRDRAFQLRPVWQRFLVVLAGPVANFMLAIAIFAAFFAIAGTPRTQRRRSNPAQFGRSTARDSGRAIALFRSQIAIRRRLTMSRTSSCSVRMSASPSRSSAAGSGRNCTFNSVRKKKPIRPAKNRAAGLLGVMSTTTIGEPVPVLEAIPMAVDQTARITRRHLDGLVQLVRGQVSPKQLGGPITIAQVAGQGAALGLFPFIGLLALLSINLGFINLLPVPMLDGGHLFFYAVEAVQRRPVSAKALDWAFRGGLAVILALLLFTTVNDLGSLGLWDRLQRLIG